MFVDNKRPPSRILLPPELRIEDCCSSVRGIMSALLGGLALDNRSEPGGRNHPCQREACLAQEVRELRFGSFSSTRRYRKHDEVVKPSGIRFVGRFQNRFDEQELAVCENRTATVLEDLQRVLVVPVMDDDPHQICVCPLRNSLKEVSADNLAAAGNRPGTQGCAACNDRWQIEEYAASLGVCRQNPMKQRALAAAYIH